ncbi:MAG: response regulator [Planctomycetes bacterium]|nr:response regulator [Planctomycetota bacterium]MCH8963827.1 response regulator [Planctomycetota bacterium]MCH8968633.1 response regulator [Planctomycetota bacterium]
MAATILIVDDAAFMRAMLKRILEDAGFEIVGEAVNGREAVQLYEELNPDLVTMDMVMPEMGGMEALQAIRGRDHKAKVVIVSAVDQRENLLEAIRSGATEYIVKPFDESRVMKAVRRALGQSPAAA